MRHVIRFEGGFDRNFPTLRSESEHYQGDDGGLLPIGAWPPQADGMRFGFMEQPGKRFVAVRVCYGDDEVVLKHPQRLDPDRHLGGQRFSPEPRELDEVSASALLGDILDANPEQRDELGGLRDRVRLALGSHAPHAVHYR